LDIAEQYIPFLGQTESICVPQGEFMIPHRARRVGELPEGLRAKVRPVTCVTAFIDQGPQAPFVRLTLP